MRDDVYAKLDKQTVDERSPSEVFQWFAQKPVVSAFIVTINADGKGECSVVNGNEQLLSAAAGTLMQICGAPQEGPAPMNRAERRRRGRTR